MKHKSVTYFIQSKDENGNEENIGHSKDEETGEIYIEFLDRSKAMKLLQAERKASPEYKYRIVKHTKQLEFGEWLQ